jgi:glucose dehydrogenase
VVTIRRGAERIDAVVVPTKQGFLFVFDRVTGRPLWPIEERPVPASDVPGEEAWPTQPFPTKPLPVSRQGFTIDDVADFTPLVRDSARAVASRYRMGPLYTPPSMEGTITMPGVIGGVGWGGAAYDPETSTLYVKASNSPSLARIARRAARNDDHRAAVGDANLQHGAGLHERAAGERDTVERRRVTRPAVHSRRIGESNHELLGHIPTHRDHRRSRIDGNR